MLFSGKTRYLYISIALGLIIHGSILVYTFEQSYDAYVHIFFASHYATDWFLTWNPKWYTGFTMTSYPPLVHQGMALLSLAIGLKAAFIAWGIAVIALFIRGVYHFSALFVPEKALKYVAFVAVFSFSFTEALHVFGQLPSLTGISLLLNACPFIYKWFRKRRYRDVLAALSLLALTTCAHHVTTIFGMVFFVLPVIGLAFIDNTSEKFGLKELTISQYLRSVWKNIFPIGAFGFAVIVITIIVILPYWLWSKSDPITQIPIPHGSRENFIEEINLGIVFFLIPWGMMLFALPYIFHKFYFRRLVFFGLSFSLLFLLGTGGTTAIPELILGSTAFNILTLDRFTFWASVMALPIWGLLFYELLEGTLLSKWRASGKEWIAKTTAIILITGSLLITGLTLNLANLKPMQPNKIDMTPIINFLQRDNHDKWRYLALGFGDQMAWLSANTKAQTIDGNYHSVRRLPEFTSRAVERLENSKYLKQEGLGALQEFLTVPDFFYLKYIFSNDKFYDPALYFSGWKRTGTLENDIVLWEKPNVPFLPEILPQKNIPKYQKWIWGIAPLSTLVLVILIYLLLFKARGVPYHSSVGEVPKHSFDYLDIPKINVWWMLGLILLTLSSFSWRFYKDQKQSSPENTIRSYFNSLDFKNFSDAYNLFIPGSYPDFEQYILELSRSDGILASYSKLDSLSIEINSINEKQVLAEVKAKWISALGYYNSTHSMDLKKRGLKWYIEPFEKDLSIPPGQFIRQASVVYKNQERRSMLVQSNEDILDRPKVIIEQAFLIKSLDDYHITGRIRNVDVDPAHLSVSAALFDSTGQEIRRYNMRDIGLHSLLPFEMTPFRIDLKEEGWKQSSLIIDNEHSYITRTPKSFAVFVESVVTDEETYREYGLVETFCNETGSLEGKLINYGTKEITIPQILLASESEEGLLWVDAVYLEEGIRSQRTSNFHFPVEKLDELKIIHTASPVEMIANGKNMTEIMEYGRFQKNDKSGALSCGRLKLFLKMNAFVNEINR